MPEFPLDSMPPNVYNAIDGYGDSSLDYVCEVETRIGELKTLLQNCDWTADERRELTRELRELRLARYEIKILGAV